MTDFQEKNPPPKMCLCKKSGSKGGAAGRNSNNTNNVGGVRAEACAVKWLSLSLSVLILSLAVAHLASLLRAFRRRAALLAAVRSGRALDPGEFLLWCVLFSFGEAPEEQEEDGGDGGGGGGGMQVIAIGIFLSF